MNRRDLLGLTLAAAGGIFAPRFGRWYRRGSGLLTTGEIVVPHSLGMTPEAVIVAQAYYWDFALLSFDKDGFTLGRRGTPHKYHYAMGTFDIPAAPLGARQG